MPVLPEPPTSQTTRASSLGSEQPASIHLEPRFVPATESQHLIIGTALRLLSVCAVRAARSAAGRTGPARHHQGVRSC